MQKSVLLSAMSMLDTGDRQQLDYYFAQDLKADVWSH